MKYTLSFLIILSVVLAGCGSGSNNKNQPKTNVKVKTEKPKKDPRKGYFTAKESSMLNAALKPYNTAQANLTNPTQRKKCEQLSTKLFNQRKYTVSQNCYIGLYQAIANGIASYQTAVNQLPGGYNSACTTAIQAYQTALAAHKQGWLAVIQAEKAYGAPNTLNLKYNAKLTKLIKAAYALDVKFTADNKAVASKCFIAADQTKAAVAKGAKQATS